MKEKRNGEYDMIKVKKERNTHLGALTRPAEVMVLVVVRTADRTTSCPVVTPTLVIWKQGSAGLKARE